MNQLIRCKEIIENAVRDNFDGYVLGDKTLTAIVELCGAENALYVLANTVQLQSWDGRYSPDNKAWAHKIQISETMQRREQLRLDCHPAVLDGLITLLRNRNEK
ncbi:DUF3849 domain-containing protein [Agathobaculum desmolans]|uniref:DUF3849 domain-containing protein n=1 Tax=Agathobaculum desmolans TaxID=39484 RepID=UPI00248E156D|nr:DUF3849 domain-containing protein [Agathobaculum desmolans]